MPAFEQTPYNSELYTGRVKFQPEGKKEKSIVHPDIVGYFKERLEERKKRRRLIREEPFERFILRRLKEGKFIDAFEYLEKEIEISDLKGQKEKAETLRELQKKFPPEETEEQKNKREEFKGVTNSSPVTLQKYKDKIGRAYYKWLSLD